MNTGFRLLDGSGAHVIMMEFEMLSPLSPVILVPADTGSQSLSFQVEGHWNNKGNLLSVLKWQCACHVHRLPSDVLAVSLWTLSSKSAAPSQSGKASGKGETCQRGATWSKRTGESTAEAAESQEGGRV